MLRLATKRRRTCCLILLVTSLLFFWIFFKADGKIEEFRKKSFITMSRNETRPEAIIKPTKESLESIIQKTAVVVNQRVVNMRMHCHRNFSFYNGYLNQKAYNQRSIYNKRYKFIMCLAEKTGCSFFKRVLYYYSGHKNISNPFILTLGSAHAVPQNLTAKLSEKELEEMMSTYFKFLFVRDPYKRLFSGYVDKIFSRYDFWGGYSSQIIGLSRKNMTARDRCGIDAKFSEFIKFVIGKMERRQGIDGHFLPIFQHCNPCSVNYDFIGKLEHFSSDATYLFQKLNLGHLDIVSKAKDVAIDDEIVDAASIVFGDRKNKGLMHNRCFDLYNFTRRTWRKLQVKGLISTKISFPLTPNDLDMMSLPQFVTLLKAAHKDSFTDPEFHEIKKYAFLEAYYSVPRPDLEKLAELLRAECEIWGYPTRPKELFDYENRIPLKGFRFFNFDDV